MTTFRILKSIATGSALTLVLQGMSLLATETHLAIQPFGDLALVPAATAKDTNFIKGNSAENKGITYKPPVTLKRAIRTSGTGSRGCDQVNQVAMIPLVPNNHIGQTLAPRPTFLAFVTGAKSVEFTLVEPNVEKPLMVKTVQPDAQGFVRVELPSTAPDLAIDKTYRWSIAVVCNPNRRSSDIFAQSWIQRIQPSTELSQQLATAASDQERARLYANASIWYDAIATLTTATQANPGNAQIRGDLMGLLNQVNLNNVVLNLPPQPPALTSQTTRTTQ